MRRAEFWKDKLDSQIAEIKRLLGGNGLDLSSTATWSARLRSWPLDISAASTCSGRCIRLKRK